MLTWFFSRRLLEYYFNDHNYSVHDRGFYYQIRGGGVWAIIGINLVYHINTKNDLYIMVL